MKKLGTPIGAAPGSAKENVGLAGVGTPALVVVGGGAGVLLRLGLLGAGVLGAGAVVGPWCELGCWVLPEVEPPPVLGWVLGVEVVPDPEPDFEPDPEPELEPEPPPPLPPPELGVGVVTVGVLTGGVGTVTGACGQDSDMLAAGPGSVSEDSGAPGGSWKVSTVPVSNLTVTVQSEPDAAEAVGSAATPSTANKMPSVTSATFSFPRPNTVALSPPDGSCAPVLARHVPTAGASRASY